MARTKQTARKSLGGMAALPPRKPNRSTLLQLMGFPSRDSFNGAIATVENWTAIAERLASHPEEAAVPDPFPYDYVGHGRLSKDYPLFLALSNESNPVTKEVVEALVDAYDTIAICPKSDVLNHAYENPSTRPEVIECIVQRNPSLTKDRTTLFQLLRFPASRLDRPHADYNLPSASVDWDAVLARVKTNPEEARVVCPTWSGYGSTNYYALEAAVMFWYPPVTIEVVGALLDACPEAVTSLDSHALMNCCENPFTHHEVAKAICDRNPHLASVDYCDGIKWMENNSYALHNAVTLRCAPSILPLLIDEYPQALSEIKSGSGLPLHIAMRPSVSADILRILLEEGRKHNVGGYTGSCGLFVKDDVEDGGQTPLECAIYWATPSSDQDEPKTGPWEKLCFCLQAAGAAKTGHENFWTYPLLHAAIEFGQMHFVFERVLQANSEDLLCADGLGRTPLIVAIEMARNGFVHIETPKLMTRKLLRDERGKRAACIPDRNGRLPLHLALRPGLSYEGLILDIANAEPRALETPDTHSHLLPFMVAASCNVGTETVFQLILKAPHLLRSGVTNSGGAKRKTPDRT